MHTVDEERRAGAGAGISRRLATYAPPALTEIGSLTDLTLNGCLFGKQLGGSDGFTFMGIGVPISNCSQ